MFWPSIYVFDITGFNRPIVLCMVGDFHDCSLHAWFTVKDDYSKNDYGQKEARDGDITKGQYHVLLPDGRTQKVSYTVDSYNGRHPYL